MKFRRLLLGQVRRSEKGFARLERVLGGGALRCPGTIEELSMSRDVFRDETFRLLDGSVRQRRTSPRLEAVSKGEREALLSFSTALGEALEFSSRAVSETFHFKTASPEDFLDILSSLRQMVEDMGLCLKSFANDASRAVAFVVRAKQRASQAESICRDASETVFKKGKFIPELKARTFLKNLSSAIDSADMAAESLSSVLVFWSH